jgi:hypothetical protein
VANFQLGDTQKVPFALSALDADGNPTTITTGDTVSVTSSDEASAKVVSDPTPTTGSLASGFIVGGKKLGTVTITASATKADGTVDITVQDVIDIVPGTASSLSLGLGVPVAQ